jgi:hypothetical protein
MVGLVAVGSIGGAALGSVTVGAGPPVAALELASEVVSDEQLAPQHAARTTQGTTA